MSIVQIVTRGIGPDSSIAGIITAGFVSAANSSPTDILLNSQAVSVDGGLNAVVGSLTVIDVDLGDSHTFTLEAGAGDTDNASFNISGSQLRCNDPSSIGIGSYSIRIQADDGTSTPFAKAFTINVVARSADGIVSPTIRQTIKFTIRSTIL